MRGGVGSLGVRVGSSVLQVVLAVVLARLLGAEGYGIYSFVIAIIAILVIPAQMGLPQLVVRETAKAQAAERWDEIRGLWRWCTNWSLGVSLALIVCAALVAFVFSDRFGSFDLGAFYWALALVPLIALGSLRASALRGLSHVVQGLLPEFILRPLMLIILALGFVWIYRPASFEAADAVLLQVLATAAAFVIGAAMLVRAQPEQMLQESTSTFTPKVWLASALPFGLTEAVYVINLNAGIVILGAFSSAEEAGIFRAALQAAVPLALGTSAVDTLMAPYFAKFHQTDSGRIGRLFRICQLVCVGVALPIAIAYFVIGRELIGLLLGPEFLAAYVPLLILTAARLSGAGLGPASMLLRMTGHEVFVLRIASVSLLANIFLLLLLAPTFGANGVAVATSVSALFLSVAAFFKAKQTGLIVQKPKTTAIE